MPAVDPDDDSIRRWVLHHYRYDSGRRQRRNVVLGAFDDEGELQEVMAALRRQIESRRRSGEADPQERVTAVLWEPGHQARAATGHAVRRALEHGADPGGLLESAELPSSMWLLRWDDAKSD